MEQRNSWGLDGDDLAFMYTSKNPYENASELIAASGCEGDGGATHPTDITTCFAKNWVWSESRSETKPRLGRQADGAEGWQGPRPLRLDQTAPMLRQVRPANECLPI